MKNSEFKPVKLRLKINLVPYLLWELYPSHHNGLFSPLLVRRDFAAREADQYRYYPNSTRLLTFFYVTLSFLCNIIWYLISVFEFPLVTLSGATTISCPSRGVGKYILLWTLIQKEKDMIFEEGKFYKWEMICCDENTPRWHNELVWKDYIYHHHHHVTLTARIFLTLSRHTSQSSIAFGRSSGLHPVLAQSCYM